MALGTELQYATSGPSETYGKRACLCLSRRNRTDRSWPPFSAFENAVDSGSGGRRCDDQDDPALLVPGLITGSCGSWFRPLILTTGGSLRIRARVLARRRTA